MTDELNDWGAFDFTSGHSDYNAQIVAFRGYAASAARSAKDAQEGVEHARMLLAQANKRSEEETAMIREYECVADRVFKVSVFVAAMSVLILIATIVNVV